MKLLYDEEELFCTKTELSSSKDTLPLAKLDMVGSRFISVHGSFFSGDTLVDIQFVTFLLLCNTRKLRIWEKTKNFDTHHCL